MSRNYCAQWDFRLNMEACSSHELCGFLQQLGKKWVFQGEQGEQSGYNHWQGRISLWKRKMKGPLMKLFEKIGCPVPNYLKPTSGEGHQGFSYVMKADTRISGPWSDQDLPKYIPKQYQISNLYQWQQQVVDSAGVWDTRKINVIINKGGNIGKSTIAHYAALHCGGIVIPPMNDRDKLIQAACCILRAREQRKSCLVFVDIPRAVRQDFLPGLYAACEQIKSGWTYDWRNTFKEWYQDSPIVWVFTNSAPHIDWLTHDRWSMWEVEDGRLRRYAGRTDNLPMVI